MNANRLEVLEAIKRCFDNEGKRPPKISLPEKIYFIVRDNIVLMQIPADAIQKNMQSDENAFEGWALVLKRWAKYEKVSISWESKKESDIDNGHYQRFLYRVSNFSKDFKEWFSIEPESKSFIEDLKIRDSGKYLLNSPAENRKTPLLPTENSNNERILELKFTQPPWSVELEKITGAEIIDRQLPVGVFNEKVTKDNSIFTGGKSAIDLWGISKNNKDLLLFELKGKENKKIGIISELYFYSCIMRWLMSESGNLNYKKSNERVLMDAKSGNIKSYFLVPKIHPLIDSQLVQILNDGLSPGIEFKYLKFKEGNENVELEDGFNSSNP